MFFLEEDFWTVEKVLCDRGVQALMSQKIGKKNVHCREYVNQCGAVKFGIDSQVDSGKTTLKYFTQFLVRIF